MNRTTLVAALAAILVTLAVVGGFLALDRTVLHYYTESGVPAHTPRPTATQVRTRWYYVFEYQVRGLTQRYESSLPPCTEVTKLTRVVPAPPNGPPLVEVRGSEGETQSIVRLAVECRR